MMRWMRTTIACLFLTLSGCQSCTSSDLPKVDAQVDASVPVQDDRDAKEPLACMTDLAVAVLACYPDAQTSN